MKHILYLLGGILCLTTLGCKKQLEKEPMALIGVAKAYINAEDARKAVTAAYTPLAGNNFEATYVLPGYMHWVLANVASDDADKGGESGSDQLYAQQVSLFNIPADNDATRFGWACEYIGVRRANLVLDNVSKIPMDTTLRRRYLAEAKFLRAWYYLNLVKTFGDVPLILSSTMETYDLSRTPKQEVYNQIIKDLEEAIPVLPATYGADDKGRATKGAAQAYLGKAYLYIKNYAKAEEWFGQVIRSGTYSLNTDFLGMFLRAGENSKEHIFQVQYVNDQGARPTNNQLPVVFGSRARNGWGFNLPTKDFVDAFEPGDPRMQQSVYKNGDVMPDGLVANVGNSNTGYLNKKYYVPQYELVNGAFAVGRDDIYMRLGKVMLWYAEAANENGNTAAALKALNDIRARARQGSLNVLPDVTTTDKAQLRNAIWREQRVEFGQEFERFFELVRQGRAGQVLRDFSKKYNTPKGGGFRDGVNEVYPIPQTEINLSAGKIKQNPGY